MSQAKNLIWCMCLGKWRIGEKLQKFINSSRGLGLLLYAQEKGRPDDARFLLKKRTAETESFVHSLISGALPGPQNKFVVCFLLGLGFEVHDVVGRFFGLVFTKSIERHFYGSFFVIRTKISYWKLQLVAIICIPLRYRKIVKRN